MIGMPSDVSISGTWRYVPRLAEYSKKQNDERVRPVMNLRFPLVSIVWAECGVYLLEELPTGDVVVRNSFARKRLWCT